MPAEVPGEEAGAAGPCPPVPRRAAPATRSGLPRPTACARPATAAPSFPGFLPGHAALHGEPRPFRARRPRLPALQARRHLPAQRPAPWEAAALEPGHRGPPRANRHARDISSKRCMRVARLGSRSCCLA